MKVQDELLKIGKEIESAKKQVAQLEGRREEVLNRLKREDGCATKEQAESLVVSLEEKLEKLDESIENDFKKLQEQFSW